MFTPVPSSALDSILATQLTVAWAGEGRCAPRRLGWWDTDLVDPAGGGDLMARLLPRTHVWASLAAVREAGRRVDAKARARMAKPDRLRTLFFLGFELDEQLGDRLALLTRQDRSPATALALPLAFDAPFSQDTVTAALRRDDVGFTILPTGRKLKGAPPDAPDALVTRLAAALVAPIAPQYPLPFYEVEA